MSKVKEIKSENKVEKERIDKLLEYKEKGSLFHGSTKPNIDLLKPREAQENNPGRVFNRAITDYEICKNNARSDFWEATTLFFDRYNGEETISIRRMLRYFRNTFLL